MSSSIEELTADAVAHTALMLADRDAVGERLLEAALEGELKSALEITLPQRVRLEGRKRNYPIPGFDALPGGPDVVTYHDPTAIWRCALAECKWSIDGDNVFETLYDLFKMVAGLRMPGVEATFLVVGAPMRLWTRPTACAELFPARVGEQFGPIGVCELIDTYPGNWEFLLRKSAGTPQELPEEIGTTSIAVIDMDIHDKLRLREPWQLRAATADARSEHTITLFDGWCEGQQPPLP